ncbi:unnamed protein product [Blepharisma stoltei]|uniref:Orn/DAP/Arg decarboxylase 2 N-terminal domain-containing protein n=1 Tax=Blepharisma stoltei TaxID=1481888 RepID=A0AAU9J5Y0_9CILI|nr:unnamed protein product [Blepharisma stoltei]
MQCRPFIVSRMVSLGLGFDCASKQELEFIKAANANIENDVIFSQPIKSSRDLTAILNLGVKYVTLDCAKKLQKIASFGVPNLKMVQGWFFTLIFYQNQKMEKEA